MSKQEAGTSSWDRRTDTLPGKGRGLTRTWSARPAPGPSCRASNLPSIPGHCPLPCGAPAQPRDAPPLRVTLRGCSKHCQPSASSHLPRRGPALCTPHARPPTLDRTLECGDTSRPQSRLPRLALPQALLHLRGTLKPPPLHVHINITPSLGHRRRGAFYTSVSGSTPCSLCCGPLPAPPFQPDGLPCGQPGKGAHKFPGESLCRGRE